MEISKLIAEKTAEYNRARRGTKRRVQLYQELMTLEVKREIVKENEK